MAFAPAREGESRAPLASPKHRPILVIVFLVLGDLAAVLTAVLIAYWGRRLFGPARDVVFYVRLLPGVLLVPLAYWYAGLYPGYGLGPVEELRRFARSTSLVSLMLVAATVLFRIGSGISRAVILVGWVLAVALVPLSRSAVRAFCARRSWWGQPVVILGAAKTAEVVARRLLANPSLGLKPVACLDDDPTRHGKTCGGVTVAGPLRFASDLARQGISGTIIAMPGLSRERLTRVVEDHAALFSKVIIIPDLLGLTSLWVSTHDMQGVLGLQLRQNLLSAWNRFLKRSMDLLVAVPALLIVGPIVLLLGGLIKVFSPGPAFYHQEREGLSGIRIRVWKLRTMVPDAEVALQTYLTTNPAAKQEWDQYMKLRHDPRIVPVVGNLLRRLSLDELPQLWNVVKGEMSLVGPRPFPEYHLVRFGPHFRALRCRVTPGLTGLWQVSARSDADLAIQEELDTYYIRNWSLWLDVYLLARTVTAVLFSKGAY